jgi:hypothetical protein
MERSLIEVLGRIALSVESIAESLKKRPVHRSALHDVEQHNAIRFVLFSEDDWENRDLDVLYADFDRHPLEEEEVVDWSEDDGYVDPHEFDSYSAEYDSSNWLRDAAGSSDPEVMRDAYWNMD